ncbi:MAG TPA: GAF domain-containing protein, partial [Anaerolineales bacterium]|nr:GAF domain-containing protein [Anaerolineales bacterium]
MLIQSYIKGIGYQLEDVRVLEFVAQHIATALTRARAIEAERLRTDELAILNSVGEAMAQTLDVKTVTKIVGDKVRGIFKSEVTEILMLDESTNLIHTPYSYIRGYVEDEPFAFGEGLTSRVIRTREPLVFKTWAEQLELGSLNPPHGADGIPESYMGVPIITGEKVLGVVSVQSYQQNAYNENHVRLLETLASNMGVAIENARLFEAEQERVAELAIINSVQAALAAELKIQGIYEAVGDKLREIFHGKDLMIRIYDPETKMLGFPYAFQKGKRISIPPMPLVERGFSPHVLRTRETLVIHENFAQEVEKYGSFTLPGTVPAKSAVYVPLAVGDQARGLIALEDIEHEHAYSDSDVRLLQTLANSMSVALENARLFDETQRLFKAEQERVAELQIINSIQQGLASELDFQAIVDLVGDKLREVFNTPDLGINWYDEKTNLLHYLYNYEHGKRLTIAPRPPTPGGTFETVTKTRQPTIEKTAEYLARLNITVFPGTDQSKSMISVPIISSDRVLGTIGMENYERENAYGESELRLLTTIAASLGTALENARLFDETQRLFKAEQERVAELQIINSIQQGLAAELDFQAIVDLVGDKLREVFRTPDLHINWLDAKNNLISPLYYYEHGVRHIIKPYTPAKGGIFETMVTTRQPVVWNSPDEYKNTKTLPGTDQSKSMASVPIISSDRVIGSIQTENFERENAFGESELRLLTTIAASLGTALENARLFDETQRLFKAEQERVAELQIINSIQQGLAAELDFQAIVDLVGDKLRAVFNTKDFGIRWYDEKTNLVHFFYEYEHGKRLTIPSRTLEQAVSIRMLKETRQPVVANTAELGARIGGAPLPGTDMSKSIIIVPIISSDRLIGSLQMEDYERENAYGESELRLLTTIAASLGTALENARLFNETQRLLQETEERNAELAVINSVQAGLVAKMDIQGIYDLVGDKIRDIFDAQAVAIIINNRADGLSHFFYAIEKGERLHVDPQPWSGISGHIFKTGQPVMINENLLQREEEILGEQSQLLAGEFPKSRLDVPMIVGSEVKGVISLQNVDREHAFSDSDLRLLTTLANSMSVALENARLFDETQRLLKETEQRNAELAIINSVQAGLVAKMDIQGIYDLVGDKIRWIFNDVENVLIFTYDRQANLVQVPYGMKEIRTYDLTKVKDKRFFEYFDETKQTLLINQNLTEEAAKYSIHNLDEYDSQNTIHTYVSEGSALFVPLLVGSEVKGFFSLQDSKRENVFSESDVRLLETLANSMSIALESARLFDETQRLLKITEDRAAELAVINSIQQGLAAELNFQAIIDLVGDKLREVLKTDEIGIRWYDAQANLTHYLYEYEHGQRLTIPPAPPVAGGAWFKILETRQPFVRNTVAEREALGITVVPGTDYSKSSVTVPIIGSDRVVGSIIVENYEKEYAFGESEVRLLSTVASSMGVALENARLFDET